ncbi:hypothetical protein SAMN05660420_00800 [Desulfuromusa kysingii]|uniref:Uncharacterized protein n=1 Tax=Desulfuromusa kysingii TaxID=37625 RepID=A0A1H3X2U6_9BACT|nr:hypothetical protein [Desulfuromusa kysingii]SDZ93719.1 hypothetical protein SAMN05660420_00800 [Desulfuromusa kysingii]
MMMTARKLKPLSLLDKGAAFFVFEVRYDVLVDPELGTGQISR